MDRNSKGYNLLAWKALHFLTSLNQILMWWILLSGLILAQYSMHQNNCFHVICSNCFWEGQVDWGGKNQPLLTSYEQCNEVYTLLCLRTVLNSVSCYFICAHKNKTKSNWKKCLTQNWVWSDSSCHNYIYSNSKLGFYIYHQKRERERESGSS